MNKLSQQCFAHPSKPLYPIYTKQQAQKSLQQFKQQKNTYAPQLRGRIQQKLTKAASVFQLPIQQEATHLYKKAVQFSVGDKKVTMGKPGDTKEVLQMAMNIQHLSDSGCSTADLRKLAKVGMAWASQVLGGQSSSFADRVFDTPVMRKVARIAGLGTGDKDEICTQFLKRADIVAFSQRERQHIYRTYKHVHQLPDSQFYKQATLNTLCDTLDKLDTNYKLTHLYKSGKLKEPSSVCYKSLIQDLNKRACDLLLISSTGTVLSKKALLQRQTHVNSYFQRLFGAAPTSSSDMFKKVASLQPIFVGPFIDEVTANG